jgi:hypothetical protein
MNLADFWPVVPDPDPLLGEAADRTKTKLLARSLRARSRQACWTTRTFGWLRWKGCRHLAPVPFFLTRIRGAPAVWGAIPKARRPRHRNGARSRPCARPTGLHNDGRPRRSGPLWRGPPPDVLRGSLPGRRPSSHQWGPARIGRGQCRRALRKWPPHI